MDANTAPYPVSADHVGVDEGGAERGRGRRGTKGRAIGRCRHRWRSPETNKTRRHAALQENGGHTPACNSTIRVPLVDLTLCLLLWTRRRRWTLRPLKRRTYVDSHAGGERLHVNTVSTRLVLGCARATHHQTRLHTEQELSSTPPRPAGRGRGACICVGVAPIAHRTRFRGSLRR